MSVERSAAELLAHLRGLQVKVWAEGDRLRLSSPEGAVSAELRDELLRHKADLLVLLQPAPFDAPLSSAQERMWFLEQLGRSAANHLSMGFQLDGELHMDALRRSLDALVQRHESLRTTFRSRDGQPVQVIAPSGSAAFEIRDMSPSGDVDAALAAEAKRLFDLEGGPLFRTVVLVRSPRQHVLLLTMHHIVSDGWSLGLILRDLSALYEAEVRQADSQLLPATTQYVDYARWQHGWLAGDEFAKQLSYWRTRLGGTLPVLELPTDRPRPSFESHRGQHVAVSLSSVTVAELQSLARTEQATLFMVLFSAFAALLTRYSGQEDIIVGTPVTGRTKPEWESLIGLFVNTLVLRTDTSGDPTFLELLRRVRERSIDAYACQDVPFERLVGELRPARDPSRNPVFQVMFDLQNMTPPEALHGLQMQPVSVERGAAQLDLTLSVISYEGKLHTQWEFSTDLFDRETILRLARHYERFLSAAVRDPGQRLSELSVMSPEESRQLLVEFNATEAEFDPAPFPQQFERQVAATPDAPALSFDGRTLSYRELNERANQIAHHLRARGAGPGMVLGVYMQRSLDVVASVIAIQKAGAGYMPLDPDFPAERLAFMLGDANAHALVTNGSPTAILGVIADMSVIDIAADAAAISAQSRENPSPAATAADTVYLLYTSGSTGRPKGVHILHGGLSNLLGSMRREPALKPSDCFVALTTLSFDIAAVELYLPLVIGARIQLVSREDAVNGKALAERLAQTGVTFMQATPSTWRMLVESGWSPKSPFRGITGGEPLPRDLANALLSRLDELWNMYGPTETTIYSTVERVEAGPGPIVIGRPVANTQIYIVDKAGQPVPFGVVGEILIGGLGLGSGYHARPDLTAERFVPDRFGGAPGGRLYRTGDVGRWRDGGRVEHMGRADHQVKIRGYRIELGEIESLLAAHPAIAQATVVARDAGAGDRRLVAYVKYQASQDLTVSEVRKYLRRELPEYMIPSIVVAVDVMPLTPTGKIDRAALPDPFHLVRRAAPEHVPPVPGPEQTLAEIWREILQLDLVSADDNFYELGGHSLLSIRVAAMAEKRLGWRMDPRILFFQTLRQVVATSAAAADPDHKGSTR